MSDIRQAKVKEHRGNDLLAESLFEVTWLSSYKNFAAEAGAGLYLLIVIRQPSFPFLPYSQKIF